MNIKDIEVQNKIRSLYDKNCYSVIINNIKKGTGFLCKRQLAGETVIGFIMPKNILLKDDNNKSQKNYSEDNLVDSFCLGKENEKIIIKLKNIKRKKYPIQDFLIMIEIKPDLDKIKIDENINDAYFEEENNKNGFCVLNEKEKFRLYESLSDIKKIENNKREQNRYFCSPIISLNNFKVIGIKYKKDIDDYNILLMKNIIDDLRDEIILKYKKIDNGNNLLLGEPFLENNKDKFKVIFDGQEIQIEELIEKFKQSKNKEFEIKLKKLKPITDMSFILYYCKSLYYADFSNWNTSTVTNMSSLFYCCKSLKFLKGINFDTSNVTDISYMFYKCKNKNFELPSDISEWNVSKVTKMNNLFSECKYIKKLPDISNWNISNVKDIRDLFYNCKSLEYMPIISKWNLKNVIHFQNICFNCEYAKSKSNISELNDTDDKDKNKNFDSYQPFIYLNELIKCDFNIFKSFLSKFSHIFKSSKAQKNLKNEKNTLYNSSELFLFNIKDPIKNLFTKYTDRSSLFLLNFIDVDQYLSNKNNEIPISLDIKNIFNIYQLIKNNREKFNYILMFLILLMKLKDIKKISARKSQKKILFQK